MRFCIVFGLFSFFVFVSVLDVLFCVCHLYQICRFPFFFCFFFRLFLVVVAEFSALFFCPERACVVPTSFFFFFSSSSGGWGKIKLIEYCADIIEYFLARPCGMMNAATLLPSCARNGLHVPPFARPCRRIYPISDL